MTKTFNTVRKRGRWVFENIYARKIEGGIGSPTEGNTFYVDETSGSAGNSGRSANAPLNTVTAALALCADDHDDYIFVMDCWSASDPITPTIEQIHIIGINNPQADWCCLNAATDVAIFVLSSSCNASEVAGFNIGGGSSHGGVETFGATGLWLHHCAFGHEYSQDTPLYGIWNGAGSLNTAFALIENCHFFGDQANANGTITSNGIYQSAGGSDKTFKNSVIRNCVFVGLTGATNAGAICLNGCKGTEVLDNTFFVPDAANGEAINLLSTEACQGVIVVGNRAANGMLNAGYTYNPFRDLNTNTLNGWGMNYRGNEVIEPIGA